MPSRRGAVSMAFSWFRYCSSAAACCRAYGAYWLSTARRSCRFAGSLREAVCCPRRFARSWRPSFRVANGSRARTMSLTIADRKTPSRRKSSCSIGVIASLPPQRSPTTARYRDPLRTSTERACPHADTARGLVCARALLRRAGCGGRSSCGAVVAVRYFGRGDTLRYEERRFAGARAPETVARTASEQSADRSRSVAHSARRNRYSERTSARASGKVGRALARQRMADGDQAALVDTRWRLRIRSARLSLLAPAGCHCPPQRSGGLDRAVRAHSCRRC